MPIKFFVLGGRGSLGLGEGEGCRFYYYGRGDFSDKLRSPGSLISIFLSDASI